MNRKGFTLIELLIVVVIIGILAAIAIPKFANTKEKAYLASMKADLRNLVNAQESYFADWTTYAAAGAGGFTYNQSAGVTIAVGAVAGDGWDATATHTGAPTKTCAIAVGSGTNSVKGTAAEGEPACN
ncbi:MAG: prepilin-type N-terminal cleavage/methylation domain-containing protein [Gemmatimonadota bacterium]|nr:MAG: prepilin-type N-terminal cleavage/methylation domain-containing protein [Gemmatimonadota bacterium]